MKFLSEKTYIPKILKQNYSGGAVLEIAAGRTANRDLFETYVGTDLPNHPYPGEGRLDLFCDARDLPFVEESFDFIFIVGALFLIPNPAKVVSTVFKLLKKEGAFMVFDYGYKSQKMQYESICAETGQAPEFAFWNSAELREMLLAPGFATVKRIFPLGRIYHVGKKLLMNDHRWLIFKALKSR